MAEPGIVVRNGLSRLRHALALILEDRDGRLGGLMRELLGEMSEGLRLSDERINHYDLKIGRLCTQDERWRRPVAIEGIGPPAATAMVGQWEMRGNLKAGESLRPGWAWYRGASQERQPGGDAGHQQTRRPLPALLIHGAWAVVSVAERRRDARSVWVSRIKQRQRGGANIAAVANKNARVLWALLSRNDSYRTSRGYRATGNRRETSIRPG